MPRQTPYRTGSNHNLLVNENDNAGPGTLSRMITRQKSAVYKRNNLYIGQLKG